MVSYWRAGTQNSISAFLRVGVMRLSEDDRHEKSLHTWYVFWKQLPVFISKAIAKSTTMAVVIEGCFVFINSLIFIFFCAFFFSFLDFALFYQTINIGK